MAWDFSTEPEFQEKLDWARQFVQDRVEPLDLLYPHRQFHPLDDELRPIVDPMKQEVRDHDLWAAHLGPELGGKGYGQLKLALLERDPRACPAGPPSSSGPRPPTPATPRSSPTTGPTSRRRRTSSRCSTARCFSCYSMTEPQAGSDPQQFTTTGRPGRRRVGHQRVEVLLLQRPHRRLPHRHGHHRSRRERLPGGVDVPRARPTPPGSTWSATSAWPGSPRTRACTPSSTTRTSGCRPTSLLGGEGQAFAIAQTRLGGGRVHHAMRTVATCQRALDLLCERVLSRETQGSLLARKQFIQGDIADSYAELAAVPPARPVHRLGDRPVQGLPADPEEHRRHQGAHPQGRPRRGVALDARPRGARGVQRDAVRRHVDDGAHHERGRRADRGAQGHGGPRGPEGLRARARACGRPPTCPAKREEARPEAGRATSSTSSATPEHGLMRAARCRAVRAPVAPSWWSRMPDPVPRRARWWSTWPPPPSTSPTSCWWPTSTRSTCRCPSRRAASSPAPCRAVGPGVEGLAVGDRVMGADPDRGLRRADRRAGVGSLRAVDAGVDLRRRRPRGGPPHRLPRAAQRGPDRSPGSGSWSSGPPAASAWPPSSSARSSGPRCWPPPRPRRSWRCASRRGPRPASTTRPRT